MMQTPDSVKEYCPHIHAVKCIPFINFAKIQPL